MKRHYRKLTVSHWWAERLRLAVHPDRLVVEKIGRGWHSPVVARTTLTRPDGAADGWRPLLAMLGETLAMRPWRATALEVVLSHHWCRLALLPGGVALRNRQEELQFTRLRLTQANGDLPDNWAITIAQSNPGAPRIACAADSELLAALDAAAAHGKSRVVSIQPVLAAALNDNRRSISDPHVWFCTIEGERICLARLQQKSWQSIRVARVFGQPGEALARLLNQESLLTEPDLLPREVALYAPDTTEIAIPPGNRWKFRYLSTVAGSASTAFVTAGNTPS